MSTETETVRLTKTRRDRTDVSIILTAGALLIIGLVMGLGASSIRSAEAAGSAFTWFARQFLWAALGVAALVFGWRFDYRRLRNLSYVLVPVVWVLLAITFLSEPVGGARRWIEFGTFQLQPSEFAKLVLIVFGADVLSRKIGKLDDWRHLVVPYLAAVGVTCLLVLLQPDFGTTVIIAVAALAVCYLVGADLRTLGGITGIAALVAVPVMMSASYRRARLFAFLSGGADCLNTAYQTCQGLVALGSGRIFGLGLGSSRQKYGHLPNPETDFIFAILGEETGLVGTLTVLALFALLLVLGVRAAKRARDPFGFVIAAGVTAWITMQVLINVGAVAGILPITGVPLPLISFGGTSLLVSLAGLGLVASVARRGVRLPRKPT
ncbi:MAG TPA: putative lipid II flippase FtsW [Actinomycetota bacterium]|nr:putative lipid II flippase FtsW [Actinomycetota bacterium]